MPKSTGTIANAALAVGLLGVVAFGAVQLGQARTAGAEPASVVETIEPVIPTDAPNGLADEQEAAAAQAEADRLAAEAAAAAAAQAEAERIAAEQAAAAEPIESFDEPSDEGGEPAPEPPAPPAPTTEWDPNTQPHTVCEVLADGTPVPCQ